jgi:outer membrane protein assembly factor BamB
VGGSFRRIGRRAWSHLAAFCLASAPTGLSAVGGDNVVSLSWSGTAAGYDVYRSRVSGGAYEMVGSSATLGFTDTTVHGGVAYFYVVRAVDECESDPSNEASATPSGACTLPADFDGVGWVGQAAGPGCAVNLSWTAAAAPCGGDVTYSAYRGAPGFVLDSSTRVAAGIAGTAYLDTVFLAPGQTYEYVVRASVAGIEDANEIRAALATSACTSTPPSPLRVLTVRSGEGSNTIEWANPLAPYTGAHVCSKAGGYPTGPTDGACQHVAGAAGGTGQAVDAVPNGETRYYAAWADATGLGDYSTPQTSWGRPASTSGAFKWAYTTRATTVAPLGVIPGRSYFAVSNDKVFHGMTATAEGGVWPSTFVPPSLGAAAQGRPLVVHLSAGVAGATDLAIVAAQDGRVYAFDAETGTSLWTSVVLGDLIQAAPAALFTAFGGGYDLLFVGTRNSTAANSLYALRLADGVVAWRFDNGGGGDPAEAIGLITTQAHVDYTAPPRLYFTSHPRAGGSQHTVWCLQFTATSATRVWSQPVGSVAIDTGPVRTTSALYLGNADGQVYKLDPDDGTSLWSAAYETGDGPVKGYVWPEGGLLFFSTNDLVHGIDGSGSTPTAFWTGGVASSGAVAVANPSPPIVWEGRVYVGGGDGSVYSIDAASSPGTPTSVPLGDPVVPKVLGSPTLDTTIDLMLIGSDQGAVYAVQLPF